MIGYSTITQKGQVTIPAAVRKDLGLLPKRQVVIINDGDWAKIKAVSDVSSLRGSIKTHKKFNIKAMRKSAMKLVVKRHLKNFRNA